MIMPGNIHLHQNQEHHFVINGITNTVPDKSDEKDQERGNWSRKLDYMMSCLSYVVGLGSVWRFPYICYRNGGEMSFGQFASSGVASVWKASPIFEGVGWAMLLSSFFLCIYYNMIIAYAIYYLFASLKETLPWQECGEWSSEACSNVRTDVVKNCTDNGGVFCYEKCFYHKDVSSNTLENVSDCSIRDPVSPSGEYFHKAVLGITNDIYDMGSIKWELALCLLLAWVIVCVWLAKGIKSNAKAAYFTVIFPYLVLSILLVRSLSLKGSVDGIFYFLKPQWHKLLGARVWGDAAVQAFKSLSLCLGGHITLSSYNKFHNNCLKDAVTVSAIACLTCVFSGVVIFGIIGYMAAELNQPIDEVVQAGTGLAFIVYPDVVTKLPISQLWSSLFFTMLIARGFGCQISFVSTVHTTLLDKFPKLFRKNRKRRKLLLIGVACICYLIGLTFTFQGGMYVLQLFDNYAATFSLLVIGVVESIALSWVYGGDRFLTDIESMLGYRPRSIWVWCWRIVVPVAIMSIKFLCKADTEWGPIKKNWKNECIGLKQVPSVDLPFCITLPDIDLRSVVVKDRQDKLCQRL
ncbi:hypothetical protein ACF0H5_019122 [Mactra antiquata]